MPRWPAPPFALIAMMCGLVCSARGAQFPVVPTRAWGSRPGQKLIITWRKVFINDVNFDGPIHVLRSDIAQIIKEANQSDLDAHDPVDLGVRDRIAGCLAGSRILPSGGDRGSALFGWQLQRGASPGYRPCE